MEVNGASDDYTEMEDLVARANYVKGLREMFFGTFISIQDCSTDVKCTSKDPRIKVWIFKRVDFHTIKYIGKNEKKYLGYYLPFALKSVNIQKWSDSTNA